MDQWNPLRCRSQTSGNRRGNGPRNSAGSRRIWTTHRQAIMIFEGKIIPPAHGARFWEIKIPQLGIFTQGASRKKAYSMAADALKTVVDEKNFQVQVVPIDGGRLLIRANDSRPLVARWLYRMRVDKGLSLREAAARMGATSSEAWA